MSLLGGGGKYKSRAQTAEAEASTVANLIAEDDFKRGLLANIRQARIARAETLIQSVEGVQNTGIISGLSNIASVTADTVGSAYLQKERQDQYQNYIETAQKAYKDLAKHQKKKGEAIALTAGALTAVAGGFAGAALAGSIGLSTTAGTVIGAGVGLNTGIKAGSSAYKKDWGGTLSAIAGAAQTYYSLGTARTGIENMAGQSSGWNPLTSAPSTKPVYVS